jgi:hypothetical protein
MQPLLQPEIQCPATLGRHRSPCLSSCESSLLILIPQCSIFNNFHQKFNWCWYHVLKSDFPLSVNNYSDECNYIKTWCRAMSVTSPTNDGAAVAKAASSRRSRQWAGEVGNGWDLGCAPSEGDCKTNGSVCYAPVPEMSKRTGKKVDMCTVPDCRVVDNLFLGFGLRMR